jgi:hypothetical protein
MTSKSSWILRRLGLLTALALTLAFVRPADAALIDFESLALDEIVTNQFAGQGVVFGNAVTLVAFITLNEFDFPPSSGTNVISGLGPSPLTAALSPGASHVGFHITTADTALVQFFDSLDVLLGQTTVDPNLGGNTLVEFDSPGIASVSIASQATENAFLLTVDDFEFLSPSPAPEPSAVLLMVSALASFGAAGLRRRRR